MDLRLSDDLERCVDMRLIMLALRYPRFVRRRFQRACVLGGR
ncbi:hypothetical protein Z947_2275 [Sulfitobacter geojensis]|nr:hypothetical protein Z947_2275 [Sulfitobacter geojensis]